MGSVGMRIKASRGCGHADAPTTSRIAGNPASGIRAGGDDAVRPEFPPTPDDGGAPAGPAADATMALHQALIGLRRRHPWLVDAAVQEPDELSNELLRCEETMIIPLAAISELVGAEDR